MFDFYVFFVESFYEVLLFLWVYYVTVEKSLVGWYSVERVRGVMLRCLKMSGNRYDAVKERSFLLEVMG